MFFWNRILFFTLILAISGCASFSKNIDTNYSVGAAPNESLLIMGINKDYQVGILDGRIQTVEGTEVFISENATTGNVIGPENNYIIVPLQLEEESTTHYGIHAFLEYGFLFQLYMPCGGEPTTVFQLPRGEIGYIGEFTFGNIEGDYKNRSLTYKIHYDIDKVKTFLNENYPNLTGRKIHQVKLETYQYDGDPLSCDVSLKAVLPPYDN